MSNAATDADTFFSQSHRELEDKIRQLEAALLTARSIATAVGIVMTRYELDRERAFAYLTRLSQHQNIKLRIIADALVMDADLHARRPEALDASAGDMAVRYLPTPATPLHG